VKSPAPDSQTPERDKSGDVKISKPEKVKPGKYDSTFDITEIKGLMLDALNGDYKEWKLQSGPSGYEIDRPGSFATGGDWSGFKPDEMRDWLAHGFKSEAFRDLHEMSPPIRKRRRAIFDEDGELDIDMALMGHDTPFQNWTKRESAPGLSIDIGMNLDCSVNSEVISEYERWVGRMLYTLETEGIDLDVNVVVNTSDLIVGVHDTVTTRIKVKREQEATDFSRWSVMFSPGGYRGLMFLAMVTGCNRHGKVAQANLGYPPQGKWDLKFDPETRKLIVDTPKSPYNFPADEMTEKLRAVIKTVR